MQARRSARERQRGAVGRMNMHGRDSGVQARRSREPRVAAQLTLAFATGQRRVGDVAAQHTTCVGLERNKHGAVGKVVVDR